jgi:hypothetical protein
MHPQLASQLTAFLETVEGLLESKPHAESEPTSRLSIAEVKRVFDDDLLAVLEFSREDNTIES